MLLGDATGMAAIVQQLTTGLTAANLLAVVGEVIPFVITIVPIALRYLFLKKSTKTVLQKQKYVFNNVLHASIG